VGPPSESERGTTRIRRSRKRGPAFIQVSPGGAEFSSGTKVMDMGHRAGWRWPSSRGGNVDGGPGTTCQDVRACTTLQPYLAPRYKLVTLIFRPLLRSLGVRVRPNGLPRPLFQSHMWGRLPRCLWTRTCSHRLRMRPSPSRIAHIVLEIECSAVVRARRGGLPVAPTNQTRSLLHHAREDYLKTVAALGTGKRMVATCSARHVSGSVHGVYKPGTSSCARKSCNRAQGGREARRNSRNFGPLPRPGQHKPTGLVCFSTGGIGFRLPKGIQGGGVLLAVVHMNIDTATPPV